MKNTIKLTVTVVLVALCSSISAQTSKLAHISMQELIVSMPEYDSAMVKLQKVERELINTLEEMRVEYNRKLEDYSKNFENWSELVKQSKMDELQSMQNRTQAFQEQAQENFQMENQKIMQPIVEKANKAVETVAKAQEITYVISADTQVLIFKAVGTLDLLPAVKQHLGINK
jgi:outer membrane protein